MGQEKSAIEILKDFALNSDRQIDVSEKHYRRSKGIHPRFFYNNYVIISDKVNQGAYFVNYSDSKRYGDNAMYSGLFFSIEAPDDSTIKIRKKDILDKLNPFFKENRFDSNYYDFNSKLVIEENDLSLTKNIFNNRLVQELTQEALNLDVRIRVGVNNIIVDVVPDLKGKSIFGIYIVGQWLLNETHLEQLFKITDKLRNKLT